MESPAQAIGVTKGRFSWHFTDRDETLDIRERRSTDEVIERVESERATR